MPDNVMTTDNAMAIIRLLILLTDFFITIILLPSPCANFNYNLLFLLSIGA